MWVFNGSLHWISVNNDLFIVRPEKSWWQRRDSKPLLVRLAFKGAFWEPCPAWPVFYAHIKVVCGEQYYLGTVPAQRLVFHSNRCHTGVRRGGKVGERTRGLRWGEGMDGWGSLSRWHFHGDAVGPNTASISGRTINAAASLLDAQEPQLKVLRCASLGCQWEHH